MASFDIVVLSSSPPAHDFYPPSSPLNGSPNPSPRRVAMPPAPLPALSPPASPQKKATGASVLGSRKASIPPDAIRGFATVGSLVRSEHFAQQEEDHNVQQQLPQVLIDSPKEKAIADTVKKKGKKRAPKTPAPVNDHDDNKPKPKPRSRKPKVTDKSTTLPDPELRLPVPRKSPYFAADDAESTSEQAIEPPAQAPNLTKSGKPRKPRAKKEKVEGVAEDVKPKKSRVTKPKAKTSAKATGKAQREGACVESAHFRKSIDTTDDLHIPELATCEALDGHDIDDVVPSIWEVPQSPPKKKRSAKQRPPDPVVESLELEEAVSRRRDWTPPRDTVIASPFTDSVGKENKQDGPDAGNGNFTHMISNFTYAQAPLPVNELPNLSTKSSVTITKRRRVELVDVPGNQNSRNSSPEKGKAPKKKPRTITEIATEQYQTSKEPADQSNIASEFFQSRSTVTITNVPLNDVPEVNGDAPTKKAPRKRSASKESGKGTKAKSKTSTSRTALKSKPIAEKLLSPGSALARMNRQDILFGTSSQLALEDSPTLVRQIQVTLKESEADADDSFHIAPPPQWPGLKAKGKRGLWDASSRDVEGGLLEQEDVYIPDFDRTQEIPLLMDGTNDGMIASTLAAARPTDALVIISSDVPTPQLSPQASQTVFRAKKEEASSRNNDSVFDDIDDIDFRPPPSNQMELQADFVDIDDLSLLLPQPERYPPPKQSRSRPPKANSTMPPTRLPNAKQRIAKKKSAPPATPSRSSGRFDDIDEILDSEDEAMQAYSPTPPRNRAISQPLSLYSSEPPAKIVKPKATVSTSALCVYCIANTELEWANHKGNVFSSITAHVRALEPSCDPKNPSWHEKILMYMPIVLEDFATYLNANTRIRGWRRATKTQAREWNKHLKARGEDAVVVEGEDGVLVVERDLEPWQVQSWCESMSVCCIQGNSRKGSSRKGFY